MTARTLVPIKQALDEVITEVVGAGDQGEPLEAALAAALEGAALILMTVEETGRGDGDYRALKLTQEALGAVRASVTALTVAVRAQADRLREGTPEPVAGSTG